MPSHAHNMSIHMRTHISIHAGIGSLEEASKQKKEDKRDGIARSLRYDGLVLYMQIYYSNLKTFDLYDVEYYYKVTMIGYL